MKKEFVKRLIFGSTFLFTLLLMRFIVPYLRPYSDSLGKINIVGLTFSVFEVLTWLLFCGFLIGIYFIFAKVIDQRMK